MTTTRAAAGCPILFGGIALIAMAVAAPPASAQVTPGDLLGRILEPAAGGFDARQQWLEVNRQTLDQLDPGGSVVRCVEASIAAAAVEGSRESTFAARSTEPPRSTRSPTAFSSGTSRIPGGRCIKNRRSNS